MNARRERVVVVLLLASVAAWLARAHVVSVDLPHMAEKVALHEATLRNEAPDPYQYKFFLVAHGVRALHAATGASVEHLYVGATVLGLSLLVLAHAAWIRSLYGPRAGVVGTLLLAALAHVLFLGYRHHPYEFFGVAAYCLLLRAVALGRGAVPIALGALATGVVWEKHLFVPILAGARRFAAGRRSARTIALAVGGAACAAAVPVALRLLLGTDRPKADVTPLSAQRWDEVVLTHGLLLLPFAALAVLFRRSLPDWVRWLWWTLPALLAIYVSERLMLHEARSFWALVPILTATACGALSSTVSPAARSAPPR